MAATTGRIQETHRGVGHRSYLRRRCRRRHPAERWIRFIEANARFGRAENSASIATVLGPSQVRIQASECCEQ